MDTISEGVHNAHEVLAELRVVVVDVATVEEAHMVGVFCLVSFGVAMIPCLEFLRGVFWECAVGIDFHHAIENRFHRLQTERSIDYGGHGGCHSAHKIGVGKHHLTEPGFLGAVLDASRLDNVANSHVVRTGYLAALAVEAVFQRLIEECGFLKAQTFSIGTRLLRTGIFGLHGGNGAIHRAHCALEALLEVVFAYVHRVVSHIAVTRFF